MRKSFLLFLGVIAISFSSFSQKNGEEVVKLLQNCGCNEILMIAGAFEKKYTATWLDGIELKDGFIIFNKGEHSHLWNPEKIIFIEKEASFVRVYLETAK